MLQTVPQPTRLAAPSSLRHRFENETFRDRTVEIDGNQYTNCTFIKCRIVFTGFEEGVFDACNFIRCDWGFSGPAASTLNYLAAIYHGLGQTGQDMVEGIFESIRRDIVKSGELLSSQPESHSPSKWRTSPMILARWSPMLVRCTCHLLRRCRGSSSLTAGVRASNSLTLNSVPKA